MLARYVQIRTRLNQLLDACLVGTAFAFAYLIRADENVVSFLRLRGISPFSDYLVLLMIAIAITPAVFEANGVYERPLIYSRRQMLFRLAKSCLILTLGVVISAFIFKLSVGRTILFIFVVLCILFVWAKEELFRLLLKVKALSEQRKIRLLVVASETGSENILSRIRAECGEGVQLVSVIDPAQATAGNLVEAIHSEGADCVVISARDINMEKVEELVRLCEIEGIDAYVLVDFLDTRISRPGYTRIGDLPMLTFKTGPEPSWQTVVKQIMDLVIASVALVILSLPMLFIALLIKLTSPGPVLFKQRRCGLNGRPFTMYKFRTMYVDAEERKKELMALNEMSGPVFKLSNDPRVTPLGRILRKYSLDELPQLINVLKGEMSLVGPRPLPVEEVKNFDELWYRRRMSVKPGLTCLWQISGRNEIKDFREWARLDLQYIDNWSIWLDLKILLKTIPAVIKGVGAK